MFLRLVTLGLLCGLCAATLALLCGAAAAVAGLAYLFAGALATALAIVSLAEDAGPGEPLGLF